MIYKAYKFKPPDPGVTINSVRVKCISKLIHLLIENVYECNMSKCMTLLLDSNVAPFGYKHTGYAYCMADSYPSSVISPISIC